MRAPDYFDAFVSWRSTYIGMATEITVVKTEESGVIDTAEGRAAADPTCRMMTKRLVLKSGDGTLIEVVYNAPSQSVRVWTYGHNGDEWNLWGTLPVSFVDGDQLGARATGEGLVTVYRNGAPVGSVSITGYEFYCGGGRIGLVFNNADQGVMDDFGGGELDGSQRAGVRERQPEPGRNADDGVQEPAEPVHGERPGGGRSAGGEHARDD